MSTYLFKSKFVFFHALPHVFLWWCLLIYFQHCSYTHNTHTCTAHGCILPTAPNNGQLISKTDDSVVFLCDPSYVFPDTIQSSRTLFCTDRNTWHDSLPNCVGMLTDLAR